MKKLKHILLSIGISMILYYGCNTPTEPENISFDVAGLENEGFNVLKNQLLVPDQEGLLKSIKVEIPPVKNGIFFSSDIRGKNHFWPDDANRVLNWPFQDSIGSLAADNYQTKVSENPIDKNGWYLLLQTVSGEYITLLPLANEKMIAWFQIQPDGQLMLNLGSFGKDSVAGDLPVLSWGKSDNVYTSARLAWNNAKLALKNEGYFSLRNEKAYPEVFKYLGWCTWEEFKFDIDQDILQYSIKQINSGDVPVRYVLIDDGHLQIDTSNYQGARLVSFEPNNKFPQGWQPILNMRDDDKVKWMGVWYNFTGYWNSIAPANNFDENLKSQLLEFPSKAVMPKISKNAAEAFYQAYMNKIKDYGFDFVKIDNQTASLRFYRGGSNAVSGATFAQQAMEKIVDQNFSGIINCMAHNSIAVFNSGPSAVMRSSIDYEVGNAWKGKSHIYQSYQNSMWFGYVFWGDHDMFHSSDPFAGRLMAVSKAMSAAPIYLSDHIDSIRKDFVEPLYFQDGELLRPLAPAFPLPESLFLDPVTHKHPYRVIAPLYNQAAAVVLYNLYDAEEDETLQAYVSADDYKSAGGLSLNNEEKWELPAEGLIVFDWYDQKAEPLNATQNYELSGFTDKLLLLCPIQKGWSVIGRIDKYLSPAAVKEVKYSDTQIQVTLVENGPFAIWSGNGKPSSPGIVFEDMGNGLYKALVPVERSDKNIVINR